MARQDINIGVEGNDATGDSIRESFRKVNENFTEIYAVFGQEGAIAFTSLADTPDQLLPNTIPLVSDDGSNINLVELASNSALDPNEVDTITFTYTQAGKLVVSTAFTKLSDDLKPALGGPLNVNGNAIGNVSVSQAAVDLFNERHNTDLSIDDLVITKGFADRRYVSSGLPIRVAGEPANTNSYLLDINRYINGNIEVLNHGYDTSINGIPFVFSTIYNDPNNLTSGDTYFLRYITDDQLAVFDTAEKAQVVDTLTAEQTKIFVQGVIENDDVHRMVDAGYDETLEGNFLSDVAMPRDAIVRRQGDTMDGVLTLSDHPGDLKGFGVVNGADDLQAASKFYVDQSGYSSTVNLFVSTNGDDRMIGVPPGREGSALNYAFRTINAAARRAYEIIETSPAEPGPYFQTITKDAGDSTSTVITADVDVPVYEQTKALIQLNREYVVKEVSGYLKFTYPDFIYDIETCERDTGLILDAVSFDINRGLNANFLTREAGERYYSNSSGRYAIGQQLTETVDAIDIAKQMVDAILQNKLFREKNVVSISVDGNRARVTTSPDHGLVDGEQVIFKDMGGMIEIEDQTAYIRVLSDSVFELYEDQDLLTLWDISAYTDYTTGGRMGVVYQPRLEAFDSNKVLQTFDQPDADTAARSAIGTKFDLILNIIQNGVSAGANVIYGSTYKLVMDNGARTFIDQGNPDNTDTLPGKILVGKRSGAKGRIVTLTNNDGTESTPDFNNPDTFQLIQLNGKDFEVGEEVEYGNFVKTKQVTIFVESGTYEEDYPIKLANNVSLKGDEFRRVIIRPKRRLSQSVWSDMYFFRDLEFDDIELLEKKHSTITATSTANDQFICDTTSWMNVDDTVRFVGNTLYGGVQRSTVYFIKSIDSATEFTVSETQGGATFALTDSDQTFYVVKNEVSAFVNQTNQVQGYFGRHYLRNPFAEKDLGIIPTNVGDYLIAASVLRKNKEFIQEEVTWWIDDNVNDANINNATGSIWFGFTYDRDKCYRDVGLIVDALIKDLTLGGTEFTLEAQGNYYIGAVAGQETQTAQAINQISVLAVQLLAGTSPNVNNILNVQPDTSAGIGETGTDTLVNSLINLVNYAFNDDYNPPLSNDAQGVDVFTMSDATIVRNVTVQGHGGFMCVLDPEGQILTKSPYIQTGSSFSKSDNEKRFRGGMYVDAFVGNIPVRITNAVTPFQLELESDPGQGLFIRPPEVPCPFYLDGIRYQVNAISQYDQVQGTVTVFLDAGSGLNGTGYTGSTPQEIFLQTAGNRSILGNDFTQINDLGYGLVTNNGALSEMVSMFTYYCQAAYYASNGSEIRSTNGSNGYGFFGLVAEGADPNEIPDQVTLTNPMIQPARAYTTPNFPNIEEDPSITITDIKYKPTINSQITINHGPEGQVRRVSNISAASAGRAANTYTNVSASGGSGTNATFDIVIDGSGDATSVTPNNAGVDYILAETLTVSGADLGGTSPADDLTFAIASASRGVGILNYRVSNVTNLSDADNDGTEGEPGDEVATGGVYSNSVYKLDLRADDASPADYFGTLQDTVPNGTVIEFRTDSTMIFDGVAEPERLETRPSTAINFDESDEITYRSLSFAQQDSLSQDLNPDQILTDVDTGFGYVAVFTKTDELVANYGATQGDTSLAIQTIVDEDTISRLLRDVAGKQPGDAGYAGGMIFHWDGKIHRATQYSTVGKIITTGNITVVAGETISQGSTTATVLQDVTAGSVINVIDASGTFNTSDELTGSTSGALGANSVPDEYSPLSWAKLDFSDVAGRDLNSPTVTGLQSGFGSDEVLLNLGLDTGATAEITIAISLCRATGHDFTQIGTGGFNTSNYPNVLLGDPELPLAEAYTDAPTATSSQIWERRKGRVFFVTTDQFGFFRVGKFFSVDQATGDIEFAGEVGLTNANSLGFKRGVTINEFSADDSFSDNSAQAVPTEKAVGNYINRVLGYNVQALSQILDPANGGNRIGPGFLPLNGGSDMEGDIDMGANQITNLALPGTDGTAATNKNYVDQNNQNYDQIEDIRNTEINNTQANDLLVATGYKIIYVSPVQGGTWNVSDVIGLASATKTANIIDIVSITDPIEGPLQKVTIEMVTGLDFVIGEVLYDQPGQTANAAIVDGPIDEWANASEAVDSVVNLTVDRSSGGKATYNFQIEDLTVANADVASDAEIAQSKLAMQNADTFDEDDATTGWDGTDTKVQADLGLAKFSDENFDTKDGYVRIKDNGVAFAEMANISQYQLYGRTDTGTGVPTGISFSNVAKYGDSVQDKDFASNWNDITTVAITKVQLDRKVSVSTGDVIRQPGSGAEATVRQTIENKDVIYVTAVVNGPFDTISQTDFLEINTGGGFDPLYEEDTVDPDTGIGTEVLVTSTTADFADVGDALITIDLADGGRIYSKTNISISTDTNSIARRTNTGRLNATGYQISGIDIVTVDAQTTKLKTPGGADIITAVGNSSASLVVKFPGSVDAGETGVTESNAQSGSDFAAEGFVAGDWVYTNFIEALTEADELSSETTGIGLGDGHGYTSEGANTTVFVNGGTETLVINGTTITAKENVVMDKDLTVNGDFIFANASSDTFTINGSLEFGTNGRVGTNVLPDGNSTRNLGGNSNRWQTAYIDLVVGTAQTARYADLAENYSADDAYEPGTVVVFGGDKEVTVTDRTLDHRVAGVVSTNPAYLMNSELEADNPVAVALQGRVPCKVLGKVQKGDLLVTSAIPGYAVVNNNPTYGTVIGKALESKDTDGKEIIEIVVGRV